MSARASAMRARSRARRSGTTHDERTFAAEIGARGSGLIACSRIRDECAECDGRSHAVAGERPIRAVRRKKHCPHCACAGALRRAREPATIVLFFHADAPPPAASVRAHCPPRTHAAFAASLAGQRMFARGRGANARFARSSSRLAATRAATAVVVLACGAAAFAPV
ncbi:hypothetical protein [Burkholderia sp. MSMB1498]|uniref:hypothetical protein n=1 Tax=Burkholderia sp. MSMB1498 TaxID=1637842 RepID=UPI0007550F54|nr:hypothetical protein [Burkholderia sp. MSMB1498]KVK83945.1 hypothetical protein WS91_05515 [Burkholderia sp. MSMB1498]